MRNYEIMMIVRPTLSEDETKNVVENFAKILIDNGATITESKEIGQRELSFEIKDCKSGYYYLYTVEANDDKAIKEFHRLAEISSDVIRHLITKLEK